MVAITKPQPASPDPTLRDDVVALVAALTGLDAAAAGEHVSPDAKSIAKPIPRVEVDRIPDLTIHKGAAILAGGGGVVFECHHRVLTERRYALKLQRPSLLAGETTEKAAMGQQLAQIEAMRTATLSHPNVCHLVALAELGVEVPSSTLRVETTVALLEWVPNAKPFAAYLYENCMDVADLVGLLRQLLQGLSHVHDRKLVHWDMKSANCLVSGDGLLKIMDVGNAQVLNAEGAKYTESQLRYTSVENAPRHFLSNALPSGTETNRIPVSFSVGHASFDRPWLDLYMVGRMIARMLGVEEERDGNSEDMRREFLKRVFPSHDDDARMAKLFLDRVVGRLTAEVDGDSVDPEATRYYKSAGDVDRDLAKLLPAFGDARDILELYPVPQHVVRAPVTLNTPFPARVNAIVNSKPLYRLSRHQQLGLTHSAYPGAHHVRLEHVIGAFGITVEYVRALYADRDSPDFRLLCDSRDIRALLLAALLHDVGHGAFSHYVEECEPLFHGCSHEDYAQALLRNDPRLYAAGKLTEQIAEDRLAIKAIVDDLWTSNRESADEFLSLVADILRPPPWSGAVTDLTDRGCSELVKRHLLHSIIDGALDADKLDYLRRDALHSGLDYEANEIERFLQSLTVAVAPPLQPTTPEIEPIEEELIAGFAPTIAVCRKGVLPVESMLVARCQLFNALYWHHTARAATVIVQYLIWRYLAPTTQKSGFERRRAILLEKLALLGDDEALNWLTQEIAKRVRNQGKQARIRRLRTSLADRRDMLPQAICELNYPDVEYRQPAREKLSRLLRFHDELNRCDAETYAKKKSGIIESLCAAIWAEARAVQPTFPRACDLDETTLFIDVPLGYKDQIDNLFVVINRIDGPEVTPYDRHSPMARAIRSSFRRWSRRVRIYVVPEVRDRLVGALGEERLESLAFDALVNAYDEQVGGAHQLELEWDDVVPV